MHGNKPYSPVKAIVAPEDRCLEAHEGEREGPKRELVKVVHVLLGQLSRTEADLDSAERARESAERLRHHLSYRLGQALIEGTRSLGGLVRLPASIIRVKRSYERDRAAPSALERSGEHDVAELRPTQFFARPDAKTFEAAVLGNGMVRVTGLAMGWGDEADPRLNVTIRYRDDAGSVVPPQAEHGSSPDLADVEVRELAAKPLREFQLDLQCPPDAVRMEVCFASASDARILVCITDVTGTEAADQKLRKPVSTKAKGLEDKLWGGFSQYAHQELENLKRSRTDAPHEVSYAAWALARWHAARQDHERALENVVVMRLADRAAETEMGQVLLEADCLTRLGNRRRARDILKGMLELRPDEPSLCLALANTYAPVDGPGDPESDETRLSWINRPLEAAGLLPLVKTDPHRPLAIDNLTTAASHPAPLEDQPKVSIVMPVYKARDTLPFALRGLMAQTWGNIEIIIVDDCSPDDTCAVAEDFARSDPRIRVVRQSRNGGAYPARNKGLQVATGDLITVHDSDDWSHPEKIECQVRLLLANPDCKASMSRWTRVGEQLNVIGPWLPKNSLFDLNLSSLMVKRQVVDDIGGWDEVRVNGDAEYRSRILKAYGENAICTVKTPAFLSFALTRPDSLTQSGPTNIRTLSYGLRGQYRDSYSNWHRNGAGDPAKLRMDNTSRPYVVPVGAAIETARERSYDLVVVCDYGLYGGAFGSTLHYIVAARDAGMSVAVYHWRKYDRAWRRLAANSAPVYNLNPRLYDACIERGVDILTVGDSVEADTVLIGYPAILHHMPDALPEVRTNRVLVIVNQYASRLVDGSDQQYDPVAARARLKQVFGHEGLWIPISHWVRRLMSEDARYSAPYPEPWHPMITINEQFHRAIRWRGHERSRPVVGRHSRDAYTKWPTTPEAVKMAYGVGQAWDMHFLGGAKHPARMIGYMPDNWNVVEFDGLTVAQFLDGLDFFVHYPHEGYIEEFGRAVLEAMAAGKPVVLPPQFKETFGAAAFYATPAELADVINHLWADESEYLERAELGRSFVKEHCDSATFPERFAKTISYLARTCEHADHPA